MGISFVAGSMLNSDLVRTDDLAVNANLIYFDVSANRVGIKTSAPSAELEVVGNIAVGNILIPNVGNINAGNVLITNLADPVSANDAATKSYVLSQIGGNVTSIGNLQVTDTTITTITANANINIDPDGTGIFTIIGTNGFVMPSGNTAQRPSPATAGTMRFNSELTRVEYYDGTEWDIIAGGITNQTITTANGVTTTFTLDRTATTASVLVMLNGVVQLPTTAYTVSGTSLQFTEAPASSDVIDVRFL